MLKAFSLAKGSSFGGVPVADIALGECDAEEMEVSCFLPCQRLHVLIYLLICDAERPWTALLPLLSAS